MATSAFEYYNLAKNYMNSDEYLAKDIDVRNKEKEAFTNTLNMKMNQETQGMNDDEIAEYKKQFQPKSETKPLYEPQKELQNFVNKVYQIKNSDEYKNASEQERDEVNQYIGQQYRQRRANAGLPVEPVEYDAKADAAQNTLNEWTGIKPENQPDQVKDLTLSNAAKATAKSVARAVPSVVSTLAAGAGYLSDISGQALQKAGLDTAGKYLEDQGQMLANAASGIDVTARNLLPPEQKSVESIGDFLNRSLGQNVLTLMDEAPEQIAPMILSYFTGTGAVNAVNAAKAGKITGKVGKFLAKLNPEKVYKYASLGSSVGLEAADIYKNIITNDGKLESPLATTALATTAGLMENVVPGGFDFATKGGWSSASRKAMSEATKGVGNFLKYIGSKAGKSFLEEMSTEGIQTALEQMAQKYNSTGELGITQKINTAQKVLKDKGISGLIEAAKNSKDLGEIFMAATIGGITGGITSGAGNAYGAVDYRSSDISKLDDRTRAQIAARNSGNLAAYNKAQNNYADYAAQTAGLQSVNAERDAVIRSFQELSDSELSDEDRQEAFENLANLGLQGYTGWRKMLSDNGMDVDNDTFRQNEQLLAEYIRKRTEAENRMVSGQNLSDREKYMLAQKQNSDKALADILTGEQNQRELLQNLYRQAQQRQAEEQQLQQQQQQEPQPQNTPVNQPETVNQNELRSELQKEMGYKPLTKKQERQAYSDALADAQDNNDYSEPEQSDSPEFLTGLFTDEKNDIIGETKNAGTPMQNGRGFIGNQAKLRANDIITTCHYAVVEADDLKTAVETGENQNRDRTRKEMEEQVKGIANNLDPDLLIYQDVSANNGPVVVDSDMNVESGNGRTMAILAAYNDQSGNGEYSGTLFNPQYGKANAYRQKLIAEAKKFGISADQVMSLKHPVLVRIRDNDPKVDKRSFIQAANTSQNMVMSSTETALQDGEIMKEFIDKFSSENLESKSNAEFVREFLKKVCAGSELNNMFTKSGKELSAAGRQRIMNAIFATAYGDADILADLTESSVDEIRTILNGLIDAAADTAKLAGEVKYGEYFNVPLVKDLAAAINKIRDIKLDPSLEGLVRGMGVTGTYLSQGQFVDDGLTPTARLFIGVLGNLKSAKAVSEFIKNCNQAVRDAGNPNQLNLDGSKSPAPSSETIVENAIKKSGLTYKDGTPLADDIEKFKAGPSTANKEWSLKRNVGVNEDREKELGREYVREISSDNPDREKLGNIKQQIGQEQERKQTDRTVAQEKGIENIDDFERTMNEIDGGQNDGQVVNAQELQNLVDEVTANIDPETGIKVTIYETPEAYRDATGAYQKNAEGANNNGEIALIRSNLPTLQRAREVLAHELLGHSALKVLLGGHYSYALRAFRNLVNQDPEVRKIFASVNRAYDSVYSRNVATDAESRKNESRRLLKLKLEEVGARLAEQYKESPNTLSGKVRSIFDNLKLRVRNILRNWGLNIGLGELELSNLFRQSKDAIAKEGRWSRTGSANNGNNTMFSLQDLEDMRADIQTMLPDMSEYLDSNPDSKSLQKYNEIIQDGEALAALDYDIGNSDTTESEYILNRMAQEFRTSFPNKTGETLAKNCLAIRNMLKTGKYKKNAIKTVSPEDILYSPVKDSMDSGYYASEPNEMDYEDYQLNNPNRYQIGDRTDTIDSDFVPNHDNTLDDNWFEFEQSMDEIAKKPVRPTKLSRATRKDLLWSLSTSAENNKEKYNLEGKPGFIGYNDKGDPRFSLPTAKQYKKSNIDTVKSYYKKAGMPESDINDHIDMVNNIIDFAEDLKDSNEFQFFNEFADAVPMTVKGLDNDKQPFRYVRKNSDFYGKTGDLASICKKRRPLDALFAQMIEDGVFDNALPNPGQIVAIQNVLRKHQLEVACGLCYVDSRRYDIGKFNRNFVLKWNGLVTMYNDNPQRFKDELKYANSPYIDEDGDEHKRREDVTAKMTRLIAANPKVRKLLSANRLLSSIGQDSLATEQPEIYKIYNAAGGTARPKNSHTEAVYRGEFEDNRSNKFFNFDNLFLRGGFRMQSFSDYEPHMWLDLLQAVQGLAAKMLPAHCYTKEFDEIELFGRTGVKFNMSLVYSGNGVREVGKSVWNNLPEHLKAPVIVNPQTGRKMYMAYSYMDGRKFDANTGKQGAKRNSTETFDPERAYELRRREDFRGDVGTIAVGVSDAHILALLADDNIDMVIPYHVSGLNPAVAQLRQVQEYTNYTESQNTRKQKIDEETGKTKWVALEKSDPHFDFYSDLKRTQDPKTTADNYLRWCEENNFKPKFDKFAELDREHYYKFLLDYRAYDNNGNYAPQKPVKLDMPEDWQNLVKDSLKREEKNLAPLYQRDNSGNFIRLRDDIAGHRFKVNPELVKEATDAFNNPTKYVDEQTYKNLANKKYEPDANLARLGIDEWNTPTNGQPVRPKGEQLWSLSKSDDLEDFYNGLTSEDYNDNDTMWSVLESADPFYSNTLNAVATNNKLPEKQKVQGWVSKLKNLINPEEDKWMGLTSWLKEHKPMDSLTKDDIINYIKNNVVKMEEIKYSESGSNIDEDPDYKYGVRDKLYDTVQKRLKSELQDIKDYANDTDNDLSDEDRKLLLDVDYDCDIDIESNSYEDYDGIRHIAQVIAYPKFNVRDNNRIFFLLADFYNELYDEEYDPDADYEFEYSDKLTDIFTSVATNNEDQEELYDNAVSDYEDSYDRKKLSFKADDTRLNYTTEGLENKREIAFKFPDVESYYGELPEIHFADDATGGKAGMWVRFGETETPDGKRVLVIDEVQSQRHQDGKEKGYLSDDRWKILKKYNVNNVEMAKDFADMKHRTNVEELKEGYKSAISREGANKSDYATIFDKLLHEENQRYAKEKEELDSIGIIPDAPLREDWYKTAIKRMLRLAADENFDAIAFTSGQQQSQRYNISNRIDHISFEPLQNGGRTYYFDFSSSYEPGFIFDVDSNGVITKHSPKPGFNLVGKPLSDLVGRGLAERMNNMKPNQSLEGDDLIITNQGMREFYDVKIPNWLNKYCKQWGTQVHDIDLSHLPDKDAATMHAIDITPEMKKSVQEKGQPMFSLKQPESVEELQEQLESESNRALDVIEDLRSNNPGLFRELGADAYFRQGQLFNDGISNEGRMLFGIMASLNSKGKIDRFLNECNNTIDDIDNDYFGFNEVIPSLSDVIKDTLSRLDLKDKNGIPLSEKLDRWNSGPATIEESEEEPRYQNRDRGLRQRTREIYGRQNRNTNQDSDLDQNDYNERNSNIRQPNLFDNDDNDDDYRPDGTNGRRPRRRRRNSSADTKFSLAGRFTPNDGKKIRGATSFSGMGSMEYSIDDVVDVMSGLEKEEYIADVYRDNHGNKIVVGDVTKPEVRQQLYDAVGNSVDYFHASPVCKRFSSAGGYKGEADIDIQSAEATAEALERLSPEIFTVENVERYLNSDSLKIITDKLDELGYKWDADKYYAPNYGGATMRRRMFLRAVKDGELPPMPTQVSDDNKSDWYDRIKDYVEDAPKGKLNNGTIKALDNQGVDYKTNTEPLYVDGARFGTSTVKKPGEQAPTITASGAGEQWIVLPGGDVRKLTPQMALRLMGMPDNVKLPKAQDKWHTVIGNGMDVDMTKSIIGDLIKKKMYGWTDEDNNTHWSLNEENETAVSELGSDIDSTEDLRTIRYSVVKDPDTIDWFNNSKRVKTIRMMQKIGDSLYPPMAKNIEGRTDPIKVGDIIKADENPNIARIKTKNGKVVFNQEDKKNGIPNNPVYEFILDKGDGTSIRANYDPYLHAVDPSIPINDQITVQYARENLVWVEMEVSEDDLNEHYRAEKSYLPTGIHGWKTNGVLAEKGLYLTRYGRVNKILNNSEVAAKLKTLFDKGTIKEAIPFNILTPSLREELKKMGVPVSDRSTAFGNIKGGKFLYLQPDGSIKAENGETYYSNGMAYRDAEGNIKYIVRENKATNTYRLYDIDGNLVKVVDSKTGNEIPKETLSNKILKTKIDKTRYSLKSNDQQYLQALDDGDTNKADEIIRAAANEAGYTEIYYHGNAEGNPITEFSGNPDITEDGGLNQIKGYFSDQPSYAESYGDVSSYYINTDNFLYIPMSSIDEMRDYLSENGIEDVVFNDFINDEEEVNEWLEETGEEDSGYLDPWMFFNSKGGNITQKIKDAGYKGVMWDEGDFSEEGGTAVMPFYPELIKSAGTVTKDNDGKVIPPSARFNRQNNDVRFSLDNNDSESNRSEIEKEVKQFYEKSYDEAISNNNMSLVDAILDNVADKYGYHYEGWHTSPFKFDTFEEGHRPRPWEFSIDTISPVGWFALERQDGVRYGENEYHVYIKCNNPKLFSWNSNSDREKALKLKAKWEELKDKARNIPDDDIYALRKARKAAFDAKKEYDNFLLDAKEPFEYMCKLAKDAFESGKYPEAKTWGDALRMQLQELGYDAILLDGTIADNNTDAQWLIPFAGEENIKSADRITYDDNGNPIPLHKRFDDSNKSLRFSLKDKNVPPDMEKALQDMGFVDDDEEGIPTLSEEGKRMTNSFVDILGQFVEGTIGETRSIADRSKPDYLYNKRKQPNETIETEFEMERRNKIEKSMKSRAAEDSLILEHLDADKNLITGLIRKHIPEGATRDWMLKKAARILAPYQLAKPIESLLYAVAENLMWDDKAGKMVIAPQRQYVYDVNLKTSGYSYDSNKEHGQAALKQFEKLSPEFQEIIINRSKFNNQFREDFVNRVVPYEKAKLYLARFARQKLNEVSSKIIEGGSRRAFSAIERIKDIIDPIDYKNLMDNFTAVNNLPMEQIGRSADRINRIIRDLAGTSAIGVNGIDAKLRVLDTNKGIYGYVHHHMDIDPRDKKGGKFNALGKLSHPWLEAVAGDRKARTGNGGKKSLLFDDIARSEKEATAEAKNRWMADAENQRGIPVESIKNPDEQLPEGYKKRQIVVANFGRHRGKEIYMPDELFDHYQLVLKNGRLDAGMKQFSEFTQWLDKTNSEINQAMLYAPSKAMRDLMAVPFHLLEFIRDWSIKNPKEAVPALKGIWHGLKNAASPEYWQKHTPESLGEYSESLIYDNYEGQNKLTRLANSIGNIFQKSVPVGSTLAAALGELNLSGAADIPLKRVLTTVGEELADKRGLTGQERDRFIYDLVNEYAFDTGDLPKLLAYVRGQYPTKMSQGLGSISRALVPFFGYTSRILKQMITDPVTKGAVPLVKRAMNKADANSNIYSEMANFSRPFMWLLFKSLVASGFAGLFPLPKDEDDSMAAQLQDAPGLDARARTKGRFYIGDTENSELWPSVKGMGHLEIADSMSDYVQGKADIKDFASEFLTIHPIASTILNAIGIGSAYDKKVPFKAKMGKALAQAVMPEMTRFGPDVAKILRMVTGSNTIPDTTKQGFFDSFFEQLGLPVGAVQYDSKGKLRTTKPILEAIKFLGLNIREIPFDVIENAAKTEMKRLENDSKKIQKLRDYRNGKYSDKTEQEFLRQDLGGDFGSVSEAEDYYSDSARREAGLVRTATKLNSKGYWQDPEEQKRARREERKMLKEQNKTNKRRKRRKSKSLKSEKPLLATNSQRLNSYINRAIELDEEGNTNEFEELLSEIESGKKPKVKKMGTASASSQIEDLINQL